MASRRRASPPKHAARRAAAPQKGAGKAAGRERPNRQTPNRQTSNRQAPSGNARARTATAGTGRRPPARPGAGKARAPRPGARGRRRRYAVVYDIEGPRVRLGVGWFLLAAPALLAGPLTGALTYGAAASVAGAQAARAWRKHGLRPSDTMAAAGAGLVSLGAVLGPGGVGLGILVAVAAAYLASAGDSRSPNGMLTDAGTTLQCALPPGAVAASMVLVQRVDVGAAMALLLAVSAYEIGDYLIGTGARNVYEGPAAGIAAMVVVIFTVSSLPVTAMSFGEVWALGGATALLAPAGQVAASALLPDAGAPASGLRRLDSLLLAAPLWAWALTTWL